jgi:uncharacterized membrane protein
MNIFTEKEQKDIIAAIKHAEERTSGEIKVHVEAKCAGNNTYQRAKDIFEYLSLHKTALRNGVLIYLAFEDRKFAILGDAGIDKIVGTDFWDSTALILKKGFEQNDFVNTLIKSIHEAGVVLQRYFPINGSNQNELPDDISFGDTK